MIAAFCNQRSSPAWALFLAVAIGAGAGPGFAWGQPNGPIPAKPFDKRLTAVEPVPPARITIADPQAAFVRLTSHAFGDPAKTLVQFNADGTYRHKVTTHPPPMGCPVGLPNFDHRGNWSMRWKDDHGMVQLDTGDMMAIAFAEKQIFFVRQWLPQIDRLPRIQPQDLPVHPSKSYRELSTFKPNELYVKISGARWKKSDRFNWFMYPTGVQFEPLGRFGAQFREGECSMEGFWSLTAQGTQILSVEEENRCDLRGPGTAALCISGQTPEFEEDLIRFYGTSFRPESSKADDQVFSFDSYSNSVRVTGRLTKPLKKGVAAKLELTFKAMNGDYDLAEIAIREARYKSIGNGYTQVGEAKPLAAVKLDHSLAQGKSIKREIEIVPVYAGSDVSLELEFHYKDLRQKYHGRAGFFGTVEK